MALYKSDFGPGLAYHWCPCVGGARLLRLYGDTPCPVLPASIDGLPLREIGEYCFSATAPTLPDDARFTSPDGGIDTAEQWPHPVGGEFLEQVTLPQSVTTLHNTAFYNCRRLGRFICGAALDTLGSNVFTNCRSLQMFTVIAEPAAPTGLKKLLATVAEDVSAEFCPDGIGQNASLSSARPAARLFYPDYNEFMDESAPAHLFVLNIEGEGYRYRQCFDGNVLSFSQYDDAFAHAAEGETPAAMCRVALDRLLTPYALTEQARAEYLAYLRGHSEAAAAPAVAERDADALTLLAQQVLRTPEERRHTAMLCSRAGWSEGAALILGGFRPNAGPSTTAKPKKRFDFD